MDQLPLVLLLQIAEDSLDTWKCFVFAHPRIGRWSLNLEYQKHIQRKYTQCIEYQQRCDGIIREYKLCGKLHNVDGPAREYNNGTKVWYKSGKRHRDNDLFAVEYPCGIKYWYQSGKLHRNGDLPAVEQPDGYKAWYQNDKRHRDGDLPAVEYADGTREWYQNGLRHRDGDLPAIEHADGRKKWLTS